MSALTLTKAPTTTETEEDGPYEYGFDRTDGEQIADEMLMESASRSKPGKVSGGRGAFQSADSRAWTRGGRVD